MNSPTEKEPLTVVVCVGSSCHVRGARDVITLYSSLIEQYNLTGKVILKGSFCMDRCGEGVNLLVGDAPLTAKSLRDAETIFEEKVLRRVQESA